MELFAMNVPTDTLGSPIAIVSIYAVLTNSE